MWLILLLILSPLLIPLAILMLPILIAVLMLGYLLYAAVIKLEELVDEFRGF